MWERLYAKETNSSLPSPSLPPFIPPSLALSLSPVGLSLQVNTRLLMTAMQWMCGSRTVKGNPSWARCGPASRCFLIGEYEYQFEHARAAADVEGRTPVVCILTLRSHLQDPP